MVYGNGEDPDFVASLASKVMTLDNLQKHYGLVVDNCLMKLPPSLLSSVQYGEPHGELCEFRIKLCYLQYNRNNLSMEEKKKIMKSCDKNKLTFEEIGVLDRLGIFYREEMEEFWKAAWESRDKEMKRQISFFSGPKSNLPPQ